MSAVLLEQIIDDLRLMTIEPVIAYVIPTSRCHAKGRGSLN
jgi:hypothetical protein